MTSPRFAAGQLRRRGTARTGEVRAARRLVVVLVLVAGGVTRGGSASADFSGFSIQALPFETTLAQFHTINITSTVPPPIEGPITPIDLQVTMRGEEVASGQSDGNLHFNPGDVSVPPGAAVCGSNEVDLNDLDVVEGSPLAAHTNVLVYCPTVTATPDSINSAGGPLSFTATGTGYPAFRTVSFTIDGDPNAFTSVFTNRSGGFTTQIQRPQLACGTHTLTATGASGQVVIQSVKPAAVDPWPPLPASTTFTVTGCVTPPPPPGQPKLTVNPAVFVDGTYTHVTGTGFVPGQPVTLTWQTPAGAALTACSPNADSAPAPVADAKGNLDTFCFAPPHEILGAAQIVATQSVIAAIARPPLQATAPVVVEGGSMQPSSGNDELIFRR